MRLSRFGPLLLAAGLASAADNGSSRPRSVPSWRRIATRVVEVQLPVLTKGAGDLLHGLNAGAHGLPAPFVEELAGPCGRVVVPELVKRFFFPKRSTAGVFRVNPSRGIFRKLLKAGYRLPPQSGDGGAKRRSAFLQGLQIDLLVI
jgi:hypothetical protein